MQLPVHLPQLATNSSLCSAYANDHDNTEQSTYGSSNSQLQLCDLEHPICVLIVQQHKSFHNQKTRKPCTWPILGTAYKKDKE